MSYSWMKLWVDLLEDWKMAALPDRLWRRFVEVCLVAKRVDDEGYLPPVEKTAFILRVSATQLESDLITLEKLTEGEGRPGVVQHIEDGRWLVTNLVKRQRPLNATERKRKQREREEWDRRFRHVRGTKSDHRQQTTDDRQTDNRQTDEQTADNRARRARLIEAQDDPAVAAALLEMSDLGITGKKALELIGQALEQGDLPSLLPQLEGWIVWADGYPAIKNGRGFAIEQVLRGLDPPEQGQQEESREERARKMGVCEKCWTRPCTCKEIENE